MKKNYFHSDFLILAAFFFFTVISIISIGRLKFDYDFENFFPRQNADLDYYLHYREVFENDNDFILVSLSDTAHKSGIFNKAFLNEALKLHDTLATLPHIRGVASLLKIKKPLLAPGGLWINVPFIHPDNDQVLINDSLHLTETHEFEGVFVSEDYRSLMFYVRNKEIITKKESDELIAAIKSKLNQFDKYPLRWVGKVKAQEVYLNIIQQELIMFSIIGAILAGVVLYYIFRNFMTVVLPFFVLLFSILFTLAVMQWTGKKIDILASLLPLILFIVGVSDSVHFLNRLHIHLQSGYNLSRSLKYTLKYLKMPMFLTSITTSIGFLSLVTLPIKPIRDFGLYTAIGVMMAFVLTIILLPVLICNFYKYKPVEVFEDNSLKTLRYKSWIDFTLKHKWGIFLFAFLLIAGGFLIYPGLKVNYFLLEDLPVNHPLKQDVMFFEQEFAGARPFEMAVKYDPDVFENPGTWKTIEMVENYLKDSLEVKAIQSLTVVFKNIYRGMKGGNNKFYVLPENPTDWKKVFSALQYFKKRPEVKLLWNAGERTFRISGKMKDIGSLAAKQKWEKLQSFISRIDTRGLEFTVTGSAYLIDRNNDLMIENTRFGLLLALSAVGLLMLILYKDIKILPVVLIPNLAPLSLLFCLFYIFKTDLNMSSTVVFTVAFGIAVDDTIHLLSRYYIERRKHRGMKDQLYFTFQHTGQSLIFTTIVLFFGFGSLIFSQFTSTYRIGLYTSLTLFAALLFDFLMVPILFDIIFGKKSKN